VVRWYRSDYAADSALDGIPERQILKPEH
jgi:hypothetical protein